MNRTGIVAVLCALLWISSACNTQEIRFERDGRDYIESIRQQYEVNPRGTLTVDAELGAIHISSSNNDEVDVLVRKRLRSTDADQVRKAFSNVEVEIKQADNEVRIEVDRIDDNASRWFWQKRTRVEIEVTVPVEFDLDLSTLGDDIQTGNIEGNVTAETLTGNITTGPTEGELRIESNSGNIETSRVVGKAHTTTLTGNIVIGPVDGDVTVGTNSGDILTNYVHGKLKTTTLTGNITNRHHTSSSAQETTRIRDDAGYMEQTQHSFPVEAGGTLMTDNAFASTEISSWMKNEVSVTVEKRSKVSNEDRARRAFDDIEVITEKRNNDVYITVDGPNSRQRNQVEVQITVQVPERYNLDLESSGGDIDIENAQGSVTAKTSGGDIDIQLTGTDTSIDRSCELESSGGEVKIYLPEDLAATIDAKVRISTSGFWGSGDYRVFSEFDLSGNDISSRNPTWAWVSGRAGRAMVWGDINGGGDPIRIETTNGNIKIKKR